MPSALYLIKMYFNGQGVKQDDIQAVTWYIKSAESGNADAQFNLGLIYYSKGDMKDIVKAYMWCDLSVTSGDATITKVSSYHIGILEKLMTPQQIAGAKRLSKIKMKEINKRKAAM